MATLATSESNFSDLVTDLVLRRSEEILAANYVHLGTGAGFQRATIIKGTNLLRFPAIAQLAAATTALTEGTAPTANTLAIVVDTATATQIGATIEITDLAVLQSPHELFAVAADIISDNAAKTRDVLVREILGAGTSVKYVTQTARSAIATSNIITGAQVKRMESLLEANDVRKFSDGFFRSIIHPHAVYDLQTDTANGGWMDVWKYTNNAPLLANELGRFAGVRFMLSTNAKVFSTAGASSANVYSTIFFGPDAYGVSDMQGIRTYYVAPGGDHSDPLAQKGLVGWKSAFACLLLDAQGSKYLRLEHGTTNG